MIQLWQRKLYEDELRILHNLNNKIKLRNFSTIYFNYILVT